VDHAELLRRFKPQLRYDSQEAFFADCAAEWTDNPGNELRRRYVDGEEGALIAATDPAPGQRKLTLDFLGHPRYADGTEADDEDLISSPLRDYRRRYAELRLRPGYANVMYGRAKEDSDGRLWLQYWLYYFYNDYNLAGGAGLHEGDWEMVQLRMHPEDDHPDLAVYAQHKHAGKATWAEVEKDPENPDSPLVYVARGSHASYFHAGYHETEAWYDLADGKRKTPSLRLELIGDPVPGWLRWRGRWGDTQPLIPGLHQPSPRGPLPHKQWDDPQRLVDDAVEAARPEALPPPEVRIERRSERMHLAFDFSGRTEGRPERLVVTVNSADDDLSPQTYTFAIEPVIRGRLETDIELATAKRYDIYVSTVDADGRPSESVLVYPQDPAAPVELWRRLFSLLRSGVARLRGHR
jgi:hypothetical protein